MQSEHAWLLEDGVVGPRVIDSLEWTTYRAHGGVAMGPHARIGIALPDATPLHEPGPQRFVAR